MERLDPSQDSNLPKLPFMKLLNHVELIFEKLTGFAEFDKNPEKMKKILEMTSNSWNSLIIAATFFLATSIINYFLVNNIKINNCNSRFLTAKFLNAEVTKRIIQFVNPKIIDHLGNSQLKQGPENFPGMLKTLAEQYPNAIHVAVTDQNCHVGCPTDCQSNMIAYYYKDNVYIQRNQSNQVGQGSFGSVFEGIWHGETAVFKCIKMNYECIKIH